MKRSRTFLEQLRRNAVALISLTIAVSTLSYSTWRNEKSEVNRNHRQAAFEILLKLNEFQQVVFHHRYDQDESDKGNPRLGWTYVLTIRDLSLILEPPLPQDANKLLMVWDEKWPELGEKQENVDAVLESVDAMRDSILALLTSLD
ncbi:MAG: hypothetical protein V7700_02335 [Halioglobus sp.]